MSKVHPRLVSSLARAGFYPSTLTIERPVTSQDGHGQEVEVGSTTVASGVAARIGVMTSGQVPTEIARGDIEVAEDTLWAELAGRFAVENGDFVETGGTRFEVRGVIDDSQAIRTVLIIEEVSTRGDE